MRHRRTAVAYLLAPICLLAGCRGASVGRSLDAPDQSSLSAATSNTTLANEVTSLASCPLTCGRPPPSIPF